MAPAITADEVAAEIVVWRAGRPSQPRGRPEQGGRARQRGETQAGADDGRSREGSRKGRRKGKPRPQQGGSKPAPAPAPRAPRPQKGPDPLSPFAALAALRDELTSRER